MAQTRTWDFGEKRQGIILNRHLADVLPSGIYSGFFVRATVAPSLFFDVKTTDGVTTDPTNVVLTGEGVKIEEDADLPGAGSVAAGDPADPRIDSVFVKHQFSAANSPAVIEVLAGTPATSPVPPTPPVDGFSRVLLANITVPATATVITNAEISQQGAVPIGPGAILSSLSDVSVVQSDAFAAMRKPSTANPIATIAEIGTELFRPTESSTPDDNVQLGGGELWDKLQGTSQTIAPFSITITPAPSADPRIDLVTVNPDTGTATLTLGVEAASPVPPAIPSNDVIPVCYVSVTEVGGPVVVLDLDITDVRPIINTKTPEWFDLPGITSDMKDAVTGAAAPDSGNVFQTSDDIIAALSSLSPAFVLSRLELDTGKNVGGSPNSDKCRLRSGPGKEFRVTLHNAAFTVNVLKILSVDLEVDIQVANAPGGRDFSSAPASSTWYFVYLIASGTTGLAPALVLSLSSTLPDLSGTNFTGPGYDVFRRIGSARLDGGGLFLETFSKNGIYHFLQPGTLDTALPGTNFTFAGSTNPLSDFVPPTSRRATCVAEAFENGAFAVTVFAAHPDIGSGSTGGKNVVSAGLAGTDNTDRETNEFGIDLDDSQRFKIRSSGSAATFNIWAVGYTEEL